VVIANGAQLQQWAETLRVRRRPISVSLELPTLTESERTGWQARLERLHNDCGCSAAAAAFLGAILSIAGYALFVGFERPAWVVLLLSVAAVIAALLAGKWFGHFRSRSRLRDDLLQLSHLIERRTADEPGPGARDRH
jgi:hypothetical protein